MQDELDYPGRLFVISGPSGSGKSTLVRRAVERPETRAYLSVSATTRQPRSGERNGVDYLFLSREEFERLRDSGGFLEWAEVHGNLYGTPIEPVKDRLRQGSNVLLEIDVQGAMQVRERAPHAFLIFVTTPSFDVLEARLRSRGTEDESAIQRRLDNARRELKQSVHYPHILVNNELDRAVEELVTILKNNSLGGPNHDAGRT